MSSYNGTFTHGNHKRRDQFEESELTNTRREQAAGASRSAEIPSNSGTDSCCHNCSCNPSTANCSCDPGRFRQRLVQQQRPRLPNSGTNRDTDRAGKYCSETESSMEEYTEPESESAEESMDESTAAERPAGKRTSDRRNRDSRRDRRRISAGFLPLISRRKNQSTILHLLATACLLFQFLLCHTISLNKKRLRLYKELLTALERRKKHKRWE